MTDEMLNLENSFLQRARYPKGRRTLQAILDATYELVISEGLAAASQEAIAKRAAVTQSAVRHYFPTKDELLLAFFTTGIERLQTLLRARIEHIGDDPLAQLIESAGVHYDRMQEVQDVYFFESAAFWGRNPQARAMRDTWWEHLNRYYTGLIHRINPDWTQRRCADTAFQVMTLILGGWITMGSSRPFQQQRSNKVLRKALLAGIERLVAADFSKTSPVRDRPRQQDD